MQFFKYTIQNWRFFHLRIFNEIFEKNTVCLISQQYFLFYLISCGSLIKKNKYVVQKSWELFTQIKHVYKVNSTKPCDLTLPQVFNKFDVQFIRLKPVVTIVIFYGLVTLCGN